MDIRTQDAIYRLTGDHNFDVFIEYVRERYQTHLSALATTSLDLPVIARQQGLVLAFDEILRIPEEAKNHKDQRTNR